MTRSRRLKLLGAGCALLVPTAAAAQSADPAVRPADNRPIDAAVRVAGLKAAELALTQATAAVDAALALARAELAGSAGPTPGAQTPIGGSGPGPTGNLPVRSWAVRERELVRDAVISSVANGTNDGLLKTTASPDVQFLATAEDKIGSIAFTLNLDRQDTDRVGSNALTFTLSSALDGEGEAQLLGLRGLNGGTELKLNFTHLDFGRNLTGEEKPAVAEAWRRCLGAPGMTEAKCKVEERRAGVSAFVATYNPSQLESLLDEVLPKPTTFWGFEVSADQGDYSFLDRTTFAIDEQSQLGYAASIFGGAIFDHGRTSITGGLIYKRAYRQQPEVTLCQPIADTSLTQCVTERDGPPRRLTRSIASLELRHAFPVKAGRFSRFAIAPELNVDLENDAFSLSLPLYFAGSGDGQLRAGVRGVYLNEENPAGGRDDDFTLGVFVGAPFSVFSF